MVIGPRQLAVLASDKLFCLHYLGMCHRNCKFRLLPARVGSCRVKYQVNLLNSQDINKYRALRILTTRYSANFSFPPFLSSGSLPTQLETASLIAAYLIKSIPLNVSRRSEPSRQSTHCGPFFFSFPFLCRKIKALKDLQFIKIKGIPN